MAEVSISRFEWKSETYSQAIVRDISQRKKTEELLHQRYDFIAFLSRVSADLINLDSSNIDSSVLEVLSYSGTYTACSRAMVFILNPDNTYFTPVFEWSPLKEFSLRKRNASGNGNARYVSGTVGRRSDHRRAGR
jgi:hypothetical protein